MVREAYLVILPSDFGELAPKDSEGENVLSSGIRNDFNGIEPRLTPKP